MSLDGTISWATLFDEASARLAAVSADPRIDARRIVEQAGGIEPAQFSSMLDELVTTRQMVAYDRMIERRLTGEPLQYVLGSWSFRLLDLYLDRRRFALRRRVGECAVGIVEAQPRGQRVAIGLAGLETNDRPIVGMRKRLGGQHKLALGLDVGHPFEYEQAPASDRCELCGARRVLRGRNPRNLEALDDRRRRRRRRRRARSWRSKVVDRVCRSCGSGVTARGGNRSQDGCAAAKACRDIHRLRRKDRVDGPGRHRRRRLLSDRRRRGYRR